MTSFTKQKIESLYNAPIDELTLKEATMCILLLSMQFVWYCIKITCLVSGILTLALLITYLCLDGSQYSEIISQITSSGDLKLAVCQILQFYLICSGIVIVNWILLRFIYQKCRK